MLSRRREAATTARRCGSRPPRPPQTWSNTSFPQGTSALATAAELNMTLVATNAAWPAATHNDTLQQVSIGAWRFGCVCRCWRI